MSLRNSIFQTQFSENKTKDLTLSLNISEHNYKILNIYIKHLNIIYFSSVVFTSKNTIDHINIPNFNIDKIAYGLLIEQNAISFWKGFQAMNYQKYISNSYINHIMICFSKEINEYFIAGMKCIIDKEQGLLLKEKYNSLELSSKKFINIT
jgi:hypothetical protein